MRLTRIKKSDISEPTENGEDRKIIIRGAREHNLKNVDVEIDRDKLVVITGVSGSGKSTLAFDTIYSEGRRRYIECMSPYARQFLGMMKKPEVDSIEGLTPAISIEQKSVGRNPRSTVGTTTEIYDYLRLLFARIGRQHCVDCDVPVVRRSSDQIVEEILQKFDGKKARILSPLVRARKGHYRELFETLRKQGFTKAVVDGEIVEIVEGMKLSRYKIHDIELVVDRVRIRKDQERRITESVEVALSRGDGTMKILAEIDGKYENFFFNAAYSCPSCGKAYDSLAPNMFSFNSPYGACPTCDGLGVLKDFDPELIIPDKSKTISGGGIAIIGEFRESWLWRQLEAVAKKAGISLFDPIEDLDPDDLNMILYGSDGDISLEYNFSGKARSYKHKYAGILPSIRHRYDTTKSSNVRKKYDRFMSERVCPTCRGGRLKQANLNVFVADRSIADVVQMDISSCKAFFEELPERLSERDGIVGTLVIKEIRDRLGFLNNVGLSYLSLDRSAATLSGGESQRIRLASQIGSELVGITYVLDEPSIGLHPRDNNKLIDSLHRLRDLGNTVIVVEHDKSMIERSDLFVDIGPGAGVRGGEIVLIADPKNAKKICAADLERSPTARFLCANGESKTSRERRPGSGEKLVLKGARGNNLKNVDLEVNLGKVICVTGVSGSGKSTLINDTLYPILSRHFYRSTLVPRPYDSIEGVENIDKVIEIDQAPIGRTPRSNPATYTGLFTLIRDFYAHLPESKIRGYKPGRFSFNVKGGRCEECEGGGMKKIEMNFLPTVYVTCDVCDGRRYNKETLSVKFRDKSIADVLDMTVTEALEFFDKIPKIREKIFTLSQVGLGYIKLGQQAPTLSGGEAQRVKLASELSKRSSGNTLYLLDEPTTGLHNEDVRVLLDLIDKLADMGNTAIIIEHNLDVIVRADEIIDLGPEGGDGGGRIIAQGTPEEIAKVPGSYTGEFLREELGDESQIK